MQKYLYAVRAAGNERVCCSDNCQRKLAYSLSRVIRADRVLVRDAIMNGNCAQCDMPILECHKVEKPDAFSP